MMKRWIGRMFIRLAEVFSYAAGCCVLYALWCSDSEDDTDTEENGEQASAQG